MVLIFWEKKAILSFLENYGGFVGELRGTKAIRVVLGDSVL